MESYGGRVKWSDNVIWLYNVHGKDDKNNQIHTSKIL